MKEMSTVNSIFSETVLSEQKRKKPSQEGKLRISQSTYLTKDLCIKYLKHSQVARVNKQNKIYPIRKRATEMNRLLTEEDTRKKYKHLN